MALLAAALAAPAASPVYVVVTTSGERIEAREKPRVSGKNVLLTLAGGELTSYPSSRIDWKATEEANRASAPADVAKPTGTPTPSLSQLAGGLKVSDERAVASEKSAGTMKKTGGATLAVQGLGSYFGEESVARHVTVTELLSDLSACPQDRARVYGIVKNVSKLKLRHLRARLVIGNPDNGQKTEQIVTTEPADLLPGEEAEVYTYISCAWAADASRYVYVIADVGGAAEQLAKPDGTNPFATPPPNPLKDVPAHTTKKNPAVER